MAEAIETLRKTRIEKLEKIKALGVEPYPAGITIGERIEVSVAKEIKATKATQETKESVVVAGRIFSWREHGQLIFADLKDSTGKIQVLFRIDSLKAEGRKLIALLDIGDFLAVKGPLFTTKAGELTVEVKEFQLLAKSLRPIPSEFFGLDDQETRYRQRYVDLLVNEDSRKVFETRSKVVKFLRERLLKEGFIEVETPILQPIYGGAAAKPFTTYHEELKMDLFLRISNELYLKRLIVGGFDKVFEFARDFRNEGVSRQHNPEFTMLEFYWAYATYEDLMNFTEKLISDLVKEIHGGYKTTFDKTELDFTPPWKRVSFKDLLIEHLGLDIDKINSESELEQFIAEKKLKVDLSGKVGYGAMVDGLYKEFCRPKLIQPTFLIDHPAALMALAKRKAEDPSKIASFQPLVCGMELVKAYNELNDPQDQRARWMEQENLAKKGLKEHENLDEDYIRALEYGMPPTAGWGLGVDRLVALLTGMHSIKDTILFPTLRPERGS